PPFFTLSLHDALPIYFTRLPADKMMLIQAPPSSSYDGTLETASKQMSLFKLFVTDGVEEFPETLKPLSPEVAIKLVEVVLQGCEDRKSTRLNTSHVKI